MVVTLIWVWLLIIPLRDKKLLINLLAQGCDPGLLTVVCRRRLPRLCTVFGHTPKLLPNLNLYFWRSELIFSKKFLFVHNN